MADTRSPAQRRRIMQSVGIVNTGPEMIVRRMLHGMGFRYKLHDRKLPGRPDLVFPIRRKAIFVHGCFWHGHGCPKGQLPKSRLDYWLPKIEANQARDARNAADLEGLGWSVLIVWQCQIGDRDGLHDTLTAFLCAHGKSDRHSEEHALASIEPKMAREER